MMLFGTRMKCFLEVKCDELDKIEHVLYKIYIASRINEGNMNISGCVLEAFKINLYAYINRKYGRRMIEQINLIY